jgi:hypothetical protein
MKTSEQVFNQIAAGELLCPCSLKCINAPALKRLPRPDDIENPNVSPKHESYDELIDCITAYTKEFTQSRIVALRSHATQNLKLPFESWRIFDADIPETLPYYIIHDQTRNPSPIVKAFRKAVTNLKLQFSSNIIELDGRIENNFFTICDSVISQLKSNEKSS